MGMGRTDGTSEVRRGPLRFALAPVILLIALALATATAYGASTRAEYVAQTDPICQLALPSFNQAFATFRKAVLKKKGGKQALKHPEVVTEQVRMPASRLYRSLGNTYASTSLQIAAVPPAPDDVERVNAWLSLRAAVAADLQAASRALKNKHLHQFDRTLIQGDMDTRAANASVGDFGYQFCTLGNGLAG
jgi:hypothetical protein